MNSQLARILGHVVQLSNRTVTFGRTSVSDVLLEWDGLVSSRHFKIEKNEDRYVLHDLGSTNGTLVNGNAVRSHELAHGDQITVGKTILLVKEVGKDSATSKVKEYVNPFESVRVSMTDSSGASGSLESSESRSKLEQSQPAIREMASRAQPIELHSEANAMNSSSVDDSRGLSLGFTQIRLRIASREGNGKLFWLNLGQTSTFGRSEKSDYAITVRPKSFVRNTSG